MSQAEGLLQENHLNTLQGTHSWYSLYTSLFSSYCPSDFIPNRITIMFTIPQTRLPRNIQLFRKRLSEKMCTRQSRKVIAELRRAKRASGAPWVRKFGYDVAYARTLFAGEGRESGVSPSGGGVCYKSRDAFVQPAFFLAGNRARNGVAVVAFKNMFTSAKTRPLLLHAHLRRWRKWHYHISLYFWLAHEGGKVITLLSQ